MSRGRGRHIVRPPEIEPNSAAGRDIGLSDRQSPDGSPIPGGRPHLQNPVTVRRSVPVPAPRPEFREFMAHGVQPEDHTPHERAEAMRGPNSAHDPLPTFYGPGQAPPPPVPVFVVENPNSEATIMDWSPRRFTLPANGAEPIHLVGTNSDREELLIINEDTAHNVFLSNTKAGLQTGTTSMVMLPKGMTSYLKLPFKTEVWAWSADSGTPLVSVIEVFEKNGGQRP
jgi:hypothetical protein